MVPLFKRKLMLLGMGGDPLVNKPILILPNNQQSHKYGVYTDIFCWLGANFADLSWLPCFCLGYRAKWLRLQGWRCFTLNNVMNKRASPATQQEHKRKRRKEAEPILAAKSASRSQQQVNEQPLV